MKFDTEAVLVKQEIVQTPNVSTLHGEHLREDVRPLMASIVDLQDVDDFTQEQMSEIEQDGTNVEYAEYNSNHKSNNMVYLGKALDNVAVISDIDEKNKFSTGFYNCTGVAGVGVDAVTGKELSFLTHQDPGYFLKGDFNKANFISGVADKLEELRQKSIPGSVDIVLFGGRSVEDGVEESAEYHDSIELVAQEIEKTFGFQPVVFQPKSIIYGVTNVYLDTAKRHMYLLQIEDEERDGTAFNAQDLSKREEEWGTS